MRRKALTLRISPPLYARITTIALALLTAIVFTGAAVRLTGSGLGCPTWPECHGAVIQTELDTHGAIEYGNRLLTGVVGAAAIAAFLAAFLRRPFRRDLAIIGALLPLGVVGQAVLGGMAVLYGLAPGWVMGHFLLSMVILGGAVSLAWRSRHEPDAAAANDRTVVLATRSLLPIAAWVLFSTFFGLCAVATWVLARRRGATPQLRKALTALCLLLAAQGVVGFVQYETGLPSEIVWVHVALATCTWLAVLVSVASAGRLAPAAALTRAAAAHSVAPSPASPSPFVPQPPSRFSRRPPRSPASGS